MLSITFCCLTAAISVAADPELQSQDHDSCIVELTGDVNLSGGITTADVICLINFFFLGPCPPQPCDASVDVNCDGRMQTSDIIYLVNHIFKSGPPPCDVCTLIPAVWTCP